MVKARVIDKEIIHSILVLSYILYLINSNLDGSHGISRPYQLYTIYAGRTSKLNL